VLFQIKPERRCPWKPTRFHGSTDRGMARESFKVPLDQPQEAQCTMPCDGALVEGSEEFRPNWIRP
jgi:hypothetical protein